MDFVPVPNRVREAEIERLMKLYENSLLRMCFVYLHDTYLAEDAMQETFIKAYNHFESFRGESSEKTWLMRIAINTCKDIKRLSWFRLVDRRISLEHVPEPECSYEPQDETLITQVMRLPRKYKEVVLLRYYQGMTVGEISETLGIAKPTVYAWLTKAQQRLRIELEGWYLSE
jgi:RNA polymerase sigma-70 factor (ECF subfamily)